MNAMKRALIMYRKGVMVMHSHIINQESREPVINNRTVMVNVFRGYISPKLSDYRDVYKVCTI